MWATVMLKEVGSSVINSKTSEKLLRIDMGPYLETEKRMAF